MPKAIILDTGPLGRITHPKPKPNREIAIWFKKVLRTETIVFIPEIVDYELRRNFLLEGMKEAIKRLDQLEDELIYLPLDTEIMLKAAELWAFMRRQGKPSADPKALDGDVILAAQALKVNATVITENISHLKLMVAAKNWKEL